MPIWSMRRRSYFRNRKLRVLVHREPHQVPIPQHRHEFHEIAIILSGSGTHVTGRFRHPLQPGHVLVIGHGRAHGYEETRGLNLVNILIRDDLLPRIARELGPMPGFHALFSMRKSSSYASYLRLPPAELLQIAEWADRLEIETHQENQGGHLLAEAYLTLIMGVLCRKWGRTPAAHPKPEAALSKVLSWMEIHLGEELRVPKLARHAGMSERSFHRAFRDALHSSPLDYLLKIRLRAAAEKLRHTRLRIGEISQLCGFSDSNYFSRAFRKAMSQSPRAFRVANQE
ncbi:helix-turn-helix domain-containing protein [soil metagenome]